MVEGIDGSGKSTQLSLLSIGGCGPKDSRGRVQRMEFVGPGEADHAARRRKEMFTPTTFQLDSRHGFRRSIGGLHTPAVAGRSDRLARTATLIPPSPRDVVRGVASSWVRNLYRFAIKPNVAFYFRVPLEVALGRIRGGRDALEYYEAGMDLDLSRTIEESFRIFQGRILKEYEAMAEEMGFHMIDATQSIEKQQREMRRILMREIGSALRGQVLEAPRPGQYEKTYTPRVL